MPSKKKQEIIERQRAARQRERIWLKERAEKTEKARQEADLFLLQTRKETKNPRELMILAARGEAMSPAARRLPCVQIAEQVWLQVGQNNIEARCFIDDVMIALYDNSKVLDTRSTELVNIITNLVIHEPFWVRPLNTWANTTKNRHRAISNLIRHLMAKWAPPAFMETAWEGAPLSKETSKHIDWYIHLGAGNNMRNAWGLPFPLTKKLAHAFITVPSKEVKLINEAFTWAYATHYGADVPMARAILETGFGITQNKDTNEFWLSVWRWFIANPMIDYAQFGPICDYIHNQRFVIPQDGNAPPQPGFSMHRRDPTTLMMRVEEWHKQLRRISTSVKDRWEPSGINADNVREVQLNEGETLPEPLDVSHVQGRGCWTYVAGSKKKRTDWNIVELLSSKELQREGREHHHCVVSYSHSCRRGAISIWSMRKDGIPILTIEVSNQSRAITQARGRHNKKADASVRNVMAKWAKSAGLSISRYV
jgi:hypothetical protein